MPPYSHFKRVNVSYLFTALIVHVFSVIRVRKWRNLEFLLTSSASLMDIFCYKSYASFVSSGSCLEQFVFLLKVCLASIGSDRIPEIINKRIYTVSNSKNSREINEIILHAQYFKFAFIILLNSEATCPADICMRFFFFFRYHTCS